MAVVLHSLSIDSPDPEAAARFWSGVLDQPYAGTSSSGVVTIDPRPGTGWRMRFLPRAYTKTALARLHFDLTSQSLDEQAATVARVRELGGRSVDIGQLPEEEHEVMADPDGNELCVIEPGNNFLAGCGLVGALSCDGSATLGRFWSSALEWPLVWDQDEETAIQSPDGGSKISWGGPPYGVRPGERDRFHLDVAPVAGDDLDAEVDRLVALGATRRGYDEFGVVLGDPDGYDFYVVEALGT